MKLKKWVKAKETESQEKELEVQIEINQFELEYERIYKKIFLQRSKKDQENIKE